MTSEVKNKNVYHEESLLFERIANHEKAAFSELYDRHSPKLYGLAIKILKDQSLAEDVLQEVFLTIWKKADQFDRQRGNPMAWMMILCRNRCIDALRRVEKNRQRSAVLDENTFLTGGSDSPLEIANHNEMRALLQKSLANIPSEQRRLIEMAYFEGFSQSEIAQHLDLPLGTVKTRIRSGMLKLRNVLQRAAH